MPLVNAPRLTLLPVAALAALLALGGCGSGRDAGEPQTSPMAYAYVTSAASSPGSAGAVYQYAIMDDDFASPLTPASIGAGISPSAVVVAHASYVYVVNVGDGTISQYTIEPDNTLTPMNPAAVTNPGMHTFSGTSSAAAVDPTGNFLYVANAADGTLSQFSIGSNGQLTPLTSATVASGVDPVSIVTDTPGAVYVLNSGAPGDPGSVYQYSEASNGTLMLASGSPVAGIPVAAGTNPSGIAFDSTHSTAYVLSNCDGSQCLGAISQFTVEAGGALADTGTIATTGSHYGAVSMVIDEDGANGYVLSNEMGVDTLSGALWHFQVGSTGALAAANPASVSIAGVAVAQALPIQYDTLYVLTTNSGVSANAAATGGSIVVYALGSQGAPALQAATQIKAPYPASIAVRVLLPP